MNPREHYRKLSFSIKDAEIRAVAAVMCEHIGEQNAVRLEALSGRVSMDERKVRLILEKLVNEYGMPVCAHSGKAGRWLARSFDEARETQAEYYSRAAADKRRGDAFNRCNYPPEQAEELREVQPPLLEVPEPEPVPYWARGW
ncbi:MAG: hypothetical protein WCR98_06095 [Saccharofermentanales bacterium]